MTNILASVDDLDETWTDAVPDPIWRLIADFSADGTHKGIGD